MAVKPTPEQLLQDTTRSLSVLPESWDAEARTIDVVFATGARATKYDWRQDKPYIEDLPLDGMDLRDLQAGAHVLRQHGFDGRGLDGVIGSVLSAEVDIEAGEARAKIKLSNAPSDAELVGKIKDGIVRKLSYGYRKDGHG